MLECVLGCVLEHAVFATEQLGLDNTIVMCSTIFTHNFFIKTVKHIIFIVFFMINLVMCFPMASIQEID